MKTCSKCGLGEGQVVFPTKGRVCNSCDSMRRKQRYASNPKFRELSRLRARKRAQERPEQVRLEQRRKHLRTLYNLTLEEYDAMLAAQGGACGLCGGPPTLYGRFYVDHDHVTGKLRSLLCHGCNVALGMLKDSPEICEKAAAYLRKYGE